MDALNTLARPLLILGLLAASASAWSDGRGGGGGSGSSMRPMGSGPSGLPTRPVSPMERPNLPAPRDVREPSRDTTREAPARETGATATPSAREAPAQDGSAKESSNTSNGNGGNTNPNAARRDADARDGAARAQTTTGEPDARPSRTERSERLLSRYPALLERDPAGALVRRNEVTLWLPERTTPPEGLFAQGFALLRDTEVLGRRLLVLRAPTGLSLQAAVELTQRLAPGAEVDFNHLLLDSGQSTSTGHAPPAPPTPTHRPSEPPALPVHVGLVDEALQPAPDLQGLRIEAQRCTPSIQQPPQGHGTAVARVLARSLRLAGRQPVLHAADLGCGPGAVDAMAGALQGMALAQVPVVNVSAVGPHNRVMAAVVAAFLARGHLLVAAVGNDGPAAPPLYPAAYPGVVAVTGVDRQGRVLVEAGRGEHVAFAAAGIVDLDDADGTPRTWRGTSFAAPVVAAALAQRLLVPNARAAAAAVADLARTAQDLGEPGRDRVYGFGLVAPGSPRLASAATTR